MKGFIRNDKIKELNEFDRNSDFFDLEEKRQEFISYIDTIEERSMIWFLGNFWIWKTNFLKRVEEDMDTEKWIHFEAWRYPERKNLWENFIIDFTNQLWDVELIEKVFKNIYGKKTKIKNIIDKIIKAWTATLSIAWLKPLEKILNSALIEEVSPIKRLYEFEKLLEEVIKWCERKNDTIYIVLEDIDRSSDYWIFFLETLNYFIKTKKDLEKKIIIIVPMSKDKFIQRREEYSKCIDYEYEYSLWKRSFDKIVSEFIDEEEMRYIYELENVKTENLEKIWIDEMKESISSMMSTFMQKNWVNIRILKKTLREANINYIQVKEKLQREGRESFLDLRLSLLWAMFWNMYKKDPHFGKIRSLREFNKVDNGMDRDFILSIKLYKWKYADTDIFYTLDKYKNDIKNIEYNWIAWKEKVVVVNNEHLNQTKIPIYIGDYDTERL